MLQAGSWIAGYRIERLLGSGGMGAVYLARHPELPRSDALKVLKEQAEHHHKEEEEHLFPKAAKLLSMESRASLGEAMLAFQKKLNREGEPRELVGEQTDAAAPL